MALTYWNHEWACHAAQVCRTYHFAQKGVSQNQYSEFLAATRLNQEPVAWRAMDLSHLRKAAYDPVFHREVRTAGEGQRRGGRAERMSAAGSRVGLGRGGGVFCALLALACCGPGHWYLS